MLVALIISIIINVILGVWLIIEKRDNNNNKQQISWYKICG